jgi:hypothetical protein
MEQPIMPRRANRSAKPASSTPLDEVLAAYLALTPEDQEQFVMRAARIKNSSIARWLKDVRERIASAKWSQEQSDRLNAMMANKLRKYQQGSISKAKRTDARNTWIDEWMRARNKDPRQATRSEWCEVLNEIRSHDGNLLKVKGKDPHEIDWRQLKDEHLKHLKRLELPPEH